MLGYGVLHLQLLAEPRAPFLFRRIHPRASQVDVVSSLNRLDVEVRMLCESCIFVRSGSIRGDGMMGIYFSLMSKSLKLYTVN